MYSPGYLQQWCAMCHDRQVRRKFDFFSHDSDYEKIVSLLNKTVQTQKYIHQVLWDQYNKIVVNPISLM
jgi:hypothetical protein